MSEPLPAHPYAMLFPMFKPAALAKLAKNIETYGQIEDIDTITVGDVKMVLDGRNREAACLMIGEKPRYRKFKGKDPLAYVLSKNGEGRRHLTAEELAEVALQVIKLRAASGEAISEEAAAAEVGVSRSSITRAKRKQREPEKISWTHEEVKQDEEIMDLFTAIAAVYGNDEARAIRTGIVPLKKAEIRVLAKLPKEKMLEIRYLIMAERMMPSQAVAFLDKMADEFSEVGELLRWCVATKEKVWTADFREGAFTVTVKANRAIKRS